MNNSKRISLDIIKIIAICFVIFNHTGANGYELYVYSDSYIIKGIVIFFDVFCKSGVPLFFMVSGALLLGKDESIKTVLIKRVLRYAIILVLFSFIYYIRFYILNPEYGFSLKYFIAYIYSNCFITPYWFLYIYLAFLLMLPFLRAVVRNLKETEYMYLFVILILLSYTFILEKTFNLGPVNLVLGILQINIVYPLLGYGIANVLTERFINKKCIRCGILALICNNALTVYFALSDIYSMGGVQSDYMAALSVFPTVFIFYIIIYMERTKEKIKGSNRFSRFISYCSGCTLCVFLFEEMLRIDVFSRMFFIAKYDVIKLTLCIPYIMCIIAAGVFITIIVRKIPVVNKLGL